MYPWYLYRGTIGKYELKYEDYRDTLLYIIIDAPRDEKNLNLLTLDMHTYRKDHSEEKLIIDALKHPIGTPRLLNWQRAKRKYDVTSDHPRAVPVNYASALLVIRKGNPCAMITVLIATAFIGPLLQKSSGHVW
jgi:hypothetical protein